MEEKVLWVAKVLLWPPRTQEAYVHADTHRYPEDMYWGLSVASNLNLRLAGSVPTSSSKAG